MKTYSIAAAVCALMFGAGESFAEPRDDAPNSIMPGAVRVTTRAPESDKWVSQTAGNGSQRVFKCKPLACSDPQTVSFNFSKSPTRNPDPKALEKFAKVDLPKSIRAMGAAREVLSDGTEKIETLAARTATLKGYPSVVNESRLSRGKAQAYVETVIIFAGPLMIRIQATSPNRELVQKSLDQFIEVMRIEEGPALPTPDPARPAPPVEGARSL